MKMNIFQTMILTTVGFCAAMVLAVAACDKPEEQKPAPQQVQQPLPPPPAPKPYADNPFIHEAPKPPAPPAPPIGNQSFPPQPQFIGDAKMNDCWHMNIWRDNANHVSCYFAECENVHIMSCVRDEVANTK